MTNTEKRLPRLTHTIRYMPLLLVVLILYTSTILFAQDTESSTPEDAATASTSQQNEDLDESTTAVAENGFSLEEEFIEGELGRVIFSAKGDMYSFNEIVDNNLYKGVSMFFDAKADTRYAVFASSSSIDTLIRLSINNIAVYRDLYLGEDAGIVFTPQKDEQVVITVFATGRLDGSLQAKDVLAVRTQALASSVNSGANNLQGVEAIGPINPNDRSRIANSTTNTGNANSNARSNQENSLTQSSGEQEEPSADLELHINQKLGEYYVEIFDLSQSPVLEDNQSKTEATLPSQDANAVVGQASVGTKNNPILAELPFNVDSTLTPLYKIAHRVAEEYKILLNEGDRVYLRMDSEVFDTLLEVADRYGRAIISDDWSEGTSLITFEVPSTDEYFVTASSFDGLRRGTYQIEIQAIQNELIEEIKGQITPTSPRILQKYASEYPLDIKKGEYMTAIVQALDTLVQVALVNENLNAIHFETINMGETAIIPLYVHEEGQYKLLMLSDLRLISNYVLSIYK